MVSICFVANHLDTQEESEATNSSSSHKFTFSAVCMQSTSPRFPGHVEKVKVMHFYLFSSSAAIAVPEICSPARRRLIADL